MNPTPSWYDVHTTFSITMTNNVSVRIGVSRPQAGSDAINASSNASSEIRVILVKQTWQIKALNYTRIYIVATVVRPGETWVVKLVTENGSNARDTGLLLSHNLFTAIVQRVQLTVLCINNNQLDYKPATVISTLTWYKRS